MNGTQENGNITRQRQSCPARCSNNFEEYSDNSTIHGVKYLGEKSRPWWERLLWIIIFLVSLYFCGTQIASIYRKWRDSPVIVSFAEQSTPIWEIPFPAISLCQITVTLPEVFNYTQAYWNITDKLPMTEEDLLNMEALTQVCDLKPSVKFGQNFTTDDMETRLINLTVNPPEKMTSPILYCEYQEKLYDCSKIFKARFTQIGICHTMNMLDWDELLREETLRPKFEENLQPSNGWTPDKGYDIKNNPMESYPRRTLQAGQKGGLTLLLGTRKKNFDYVCQGPLQGYWMMFTSPDELSLDGTRAILASAEQFTYVGFHTEMLTTSESLLSYQPEVRQCYFSHERQLEHFKIYNENNCKQECLTNHTLKECGCVHFSMPRKADTPVCGFLKDKCVKNATISLIAKTFSNGNQETFSRRPQCDCLPACTQITYNTQVTMSDMDWGKTFKALRQEKQTNPDQVAYSFIHFYFINDHFITARRSELYGVSDMIGAMGGLLGLFMGVSFLSIVEIFYFFFVRKNVKLQKNEDTGNWKCDIRL